MALARIAWSFSPTTNGTCFGRLLFRVFLSWDGYDPLANHPIICVRFKWEGAAGGEIPNHLFFGVVSSSALA